MEGNECRLFHIAFLETFAVFTSVFHRINSMSSFSVSEPVQRICEHIDSVTCVRFNASGNLLASGDMAGKIIITETTSLKKRCEVKSLTVSIY